MNCMLNDENTLITVSAEALPLFLIFVIKRPIKTPNAMRDIISFFTPKSTPNAIPVKALCPKASEKNAILLLTAIVPKIAISG